MPKRHTVRQGDSASSIAAAYGFARADKILAHPDNAALRDRRKNPEALLPGDVVVIPDLDPRTESKPAGASHHFEVQRPKIQLKLMLVDHAHRGLSGKHYRLEYGDEHWEGTIGDDGMVVHELPARADRATLRIWFHPPNEDGDTEGDVVMPLAIGHLDPHDEISGVQMRLAMLGYSVPTSGELCETTRSILEIYQRKRGLDVTGEADRATVDDLRKLHEED